MPLDDARSISVFACVPTMMASAGYASVCVCAAVPPAAVMEARLGPERHSQQERRVASRGVAALAMAGATSRGRGRGRGRGRTRGRACA